jgi:hypothetical protein
VELIFANLPEISGETAVFLDISGSMQGDIYGWSDQVLQYISDEINGYNADAIFSPK